MRPGRIFFILSLTYAGAFGYLSQLAARLPLPGTPAPPGSPWPNPALFISNPEKFATFASRHIKYTVNEANCHILTRAFERYNGDLLFRDIDVQPGPNTPHVRDIEITLLPNPKGSLCDEYPQLNTDPDNDYEQYTINIHENHDSLILVEITAHTVWGALRALETFSQLIWKDDHGPHFYVNYTAIEDTPRFPHRGFMLDTARHYVDLPIIQSVLDGMSYLKLNVFHWHIVDDQSFPFVSKKFPELSEKGAYLPQLTYEPEEVQGIIDYARDRGIRVIFEFDTPGHTQGFGKAFLWLLTPCYGQGPEGPPGTPNYTSHAAYEIMDPTNETTFTFLREFFTEIKNVSKDPFVHLGMDEAYGACWQSSPVVKKFIDDKNLTDVNGLQAYFANRLLEIIHEIGLKSIIWHDPLSLGVRPSKDVIIQVWKGGRADGEPSNEWMPYMWESLNQNYTTILSSCWYLNYIRYAGVNSSEFRKNYECDPVTQMRQAYANFTPEHEQLILGGEAAYWGEFADGTNFLPRIFPLLGAAAEKLWSPEFPMNTNTTDDAFHRLDQHRCRMLWRGIPAQPIYNGYCFAQEKTGMRQPKSEACLSVPAMFATTMLAFLLGLSVV